MTGYEHDAGLACARIVGKPKAMRPLPALATLAIACLLLAGPAPSRAAEGAYEPQLMRLAEILGSLHFLRNLCGEEGDDWRRQMEDLLQSENPEPMRRARMVARFNQGYTAFEANYTVCTEAAVEAVRRYMREGEALTRDVVGRFGN